MKIAKVLLAVSLTVGAVAYATPAEAAIASRFTPSVTLADRGESIKFTGYTRKSAEVNIYFRKSGSAEWTWRAKVKASPVKGFYAKTISAWNTGEWQARVTSRAAVTKFVQVGLNSPGPHAAFPGMARDPETGELFAVWRESQGGHMGDYASIKFSTSVDEGVTWSYAQTVEDQTVDNRDPNLTRLAGGRLVLTYFKRSGSDFWGTYFRHSDDGGSSWSVERKMVDELVVSSPAVEAFDSLFTVVYGGPETDRVAKVFRSEDNGDNWDESATPVDLDAMGGENFSEPNLVFDGDQLVMMVRSDEGTRQTARTASEDGDSWSDVEREFASNSRVSMVESDGLIVALYRGQDAMNRLYKRTSSDAGLSWSMPELLVSEGYRNVYASPVDLGDGDIGYITSFETSSKATNPLRYEETTTSN